MPVMVDLPGVYGAAQQFRANQVANQLNQLRLRQAEQQMTDRNELRRLLPGALQGDQAALGQVTGLDPDLGLRIQENFRRQSREEQERMLKEAPILVSALQNVTPDTYGVVRSSLERAGVDVSLLPPTYDPNAVAMQITAAQALMGPQEAPQTRTVRRGTEQVTEQFNPMTGQWTEVGRGAAFKPTPDTVVNVGPQGIDYGDPPKGMAWARNPDGTVATTPDPQTGFLRPVAVPIAGGPVEQERQQAEAAKRAQRDQAAQYGNVVLEDIGRVKNKIETSILPTAGLVGNWLKDVGGTAAADVKALTDTIRSNIGFDRLQAMRDASPTGGALGQVTERELAFLQATLGSLEQSQSEEQLLENLDRLETIYTDVLRKASAYPNAAQFGFDQPQAPSTGKTPLPVPPPPGFEVID